MRMVENGDIVYVLEEIETARSINSKASRKANEIIVFGFNKRLYLILYDKYRKKEKKHDI